jgi:dTDP-glucose pyrophosphorylase
MVKKFNDNDLFGVCGIVIEEDRKRIGRTYSIMQDYDGRIHRLIEKPKNPLNNLKGTGNCVFRNEIFSYIEETPINHNRGEKELPDLIQCAIDDGKDVRSFIVCDGYTNINSEEELAEVEINFPFAGVAM